MVNARGPQKATKRLKIHVFPAGRQARGRSLCVCKSSALWGRGEEADDMRTVALIALASCGAFGVALPCAAQSGTEAAAPRTVTVAKQANPRLVTPQFLAPPQ